MKTLECPPCFSELQFAQVFEIELDNYLRLLDYDQIVQDGKLKEQFEA
jgi:hypothetical protein